MGEHDLESVGTIQEESFATGMSLPTGFFLRERIRHMVREARFAWDSDVPEPEDLSHQEWDCDDPELTDHVVRNKRRKRSPSDSESLGADPRRRTEKQ